MKNVVFLIAAFLLVGCGGGGGGGGVQNTSGTLDPSFGGMGYVSYNMGAGISPEPKSVAIDNSGRIVVAGNSNDGAPGWARHYNLGIWRYNSNGTLDTSFGGTGYVSHNDTAGGNNWDAGQSVAIDNAGRIVVAGVSRNTRGNLDMVIWRFDSNGTLDTSFNGRGFVVHDNAAGGSGDDAGRSVVIDNTGRIIVSGQSTRTTTNERDLAIWRYNANGTLDTSFGGTGYVTNNIAGAISVAASTAIDITGRIIVAGRSTVGVSTSETQLAIWRYDTNGILDTSFGGTGYVTHVSGQGWGGYSVAIDNTGRIVVAGKGPHMGGQLGEGMWIWRYNADGTLDTSFGGTGYVNHNIPTGPGVDFNNAGTSVAFDSSGRIIVAGAGVNYLNGDSYMMIWRFSPNGVIDTSFGGRGYVTSSKGTYFEDYLVKIDGSGRYIVAGPLYDGGGIYGMGIWRYHP